MSFHDHCITCHNSKCTNYCPVIPCPKFCGHSFHQCKSDDHLLLCSKMIVPCLNYLYGCPHVISRHKMAAHLSVCPASVVNCSFKWYRDSLNDTERIKHCTFETPVVITQVDIALTLKDQLSKALEKDPEPFNYKNVFKVKLDINERDDKIMIKRQDNHKDQTKKQFETLKLENYLSSKILHLDSNIKSQPISGILPNSDVSFMCNEVVRRDGFCHHFRNLHSEVQTWSDHWIDHRCPLSTHGCTFSQTRLKPLNSTLVFDTQYHQFRVKQDLYNSQSQPLPSIHFPKNSGFKTTIETAKVCQSPEPLDISRLPQLLVDRILSYLDPYDLHELSLVSTRFRHMCEGLVVTKGMVELRWKKFYPDQSPRWKIKAHVWRFPNGFTPIEKWQFCNGEPMSKHLSTCAFNLIKLHKNKVPILQTNNEMMNFDFSASESNNDQLMNK